jgi:outer membrane immunogenic protein
MMMNIKAILMGTVALVAVTGVANAADLPYKAPYRDTAPVETYSSWTGLYLGLGVGGLWNNKDINLNPNTDKNQPYHPNGTQILQILGTPTNIPSHASGMEAGGYLGYNYQFSTLIVLGVEASIMATGLSSNTGNTIIANLGSFTSSTPWMGSVVGKAGVVLDPRVMVYGLGGVAFGEVNDSANAFGFTPVSASSLKTGWVAGLGIEYMMSQHFSLGLEYRHTDLGAHGVTLSNGNTVNPVSFSPTANGVTDEARAKLGYKF